MLQVNNQGSVEISVKGKSGRWSRNIFLLLISFSGPLCRGRISRWWKRVIDDPHTTSLDDCAATLPHTTHARDTHGLGCCRPEKKRDTTKWRATGVWTLRAVKVVAYFTSWLRETFSSSRSCVHARTEHGGVYSRSNVSLRSRFPPLVISTRMMHSGRKCQSNSKDECLHFSAINVFNVFIVNFR